MLAAAARPYIYSHSRRKCLTCAMSTHVYEQKVAVRKSTKEALKQLSAADMLQQSTAITTRLEDTAFFRNSKRIGVYIHCARLREVDTTAIVSSILLQGKRCYIPKVEDHNSNMRLLHIENLEELHPVPPFNILEPSLTYMDGSPREDVLATPAPLDLMLMPGLAFDSSGRRLGRGGGYYDKFVSGLKAVAARQGWAPPLLVALAYDVQVVAEVPVGPNDEVVDVVVTARETHLCTPRARQELHG